MERYEDFCYSSFVSCFMQRSFVIAGEVPKGMFVLFLLDICETSAAAWSEEWRRGSNSESVKGPEVTRDAGCLHIEVDISHINPLN